MSTTHHFSNLIHVPRSRPVRCFRHHVSMAACDDCRQVRTDRLARRREIARAAELNRPPS